MKTTVWRLFSHEVNRLLPENPLLQLAGYTQRTSDNVGRAESIESRWHLGLVTNSLTKVLYLKDKTNKQSNRFIKVFHIQKVIYLNR